MSRPAVARGQRRAPKIFRGSRLKGEAGDRQEMLPTNDHFLGQRSFAGTCTDGRLA
jgi:hypothetical protein